MTGDISEKPSRPDTKAGRLQRACLALYHEHLPARPYADEAVGQGVPEEDDISAQLSGSPVLGEFL